MNSDVNGLNENGKISQLTKSPDIPPIILVFTYTHAGEGLNHDFHFSLCPSLVSCRVKYQTITTAEL